MRDRLTALLGTRMLSGLALLVGGIVLGRHDGVQSGAKYATSWRGSGPPVDYRRGKTSLRVPSGHAKPPTSNVAMSVGETTGAVNGRGSGPPEVGISGEELYKRECAGCHMMNGVGVPRMQPALRDSAIVSGDSSTTIVRLLLRGANATLSRDRRRYLGEMPVFDTLTDDEIAKVVIYVRHRFGDRNEGLGAGDVAALRTK